MIGSQDNQNNVSNTGKVKVSFCYDKTNSKKQIAGRKEGNDENCKSHG